MQPLTEGERAILYHIFLWGSHGYPIHKYGSRHWTWGPLFNVNGPPVLFPTRRKAVESFERYLDILDERRRANF